MTEPARHLRDVTSRPPLAPGSASAESTPRALTLEILPAVPQGPSMQRRMIGLVLLAALLLGSGAYILRRVAHDDAAPNAGTWVRRPLAAPQPQHRVVLPSLLAGAARDTSPAARNLEAIFTAWSVDRGWASHAAAYLGAGKTGFIVHVVEHSFGPEDFLRQYMGLMGTAGPKIDVAAWRESKIDSVFYGCAPVRGEGALCSWRNARDFVTGVVLVRGGTVADGMRLMREIRPVVLPGRETV